MEQQGETKRYHKYLNEAKKILDEDHYGLEKVKERILEYLAVQKRVGKSKRSYFMFSWTSWCWKNFFRKIHSQSYWKKICTYVTWWSSR